MGYTVELAPEAIACLKNLDKPINNRIQTKLVWLGEHFDELFHDPLSGTLKGLYKYRIGNYRTVYFIDSKKKVIYILSIGHRSDIYRSK